MRNHRIIPSLLAAALVASPSLARADWEGTLTVTGIGQSKMPPIKGVMKMRSDKMRTDYTSPMPMTTIMDLKAKRAWTLIHAAKMVSEIDLANPASAQGPGQPPPMPTCEGDPEKCLTEQGYKRVAKERVNGQDCLVYEKSGTADGGKMSHKIWRLDAKAMVPVRMTILKADGSGIQMDLTDLKQTSVPDSEFVPPADYRKAPAGMPMMPPPRR